MTHQRKPSGRREAPTPKLTTLHARERALPLVLRPWLPFERTVPRNPDGTPSQLGRGETFWANAHYLVHRTEFRNDQGVLGCVHLSMRTVENDTRHDWREMMRVKDELCGEDWEGVELYPAQDRVVDTANQYHLFVFPPDGVGYSIIREIGFTQGRHVYGPDDEVPGDFTKGASAAGSVQRPLDSSWEPQVDLPFGAMSWASQVQQYPAMGAPGIGYFAGDVSEAHPGLPPIDCLLWRDEWGLVRGILNHYPVDYPPLEKAGNVNLWVDPEWQRKGIASALWTEAVERWNVRLETQRYTKDGAAWARAMIGARR